VKSLAFTAFDARSGERRGRRLRRARFEVRSSLPISAACVVANGARETLNSLLGAPVALRLFEPSIPSPAGWRAILDGARCYRFRGNIAEAAVVLRAADAVSLAAALFGELSTAPPAERELSPIERDVLERLVNAIAANLGVVCGARDGHALDSATDAAFVTYFELLVEEPLLARIGVALSRDSLPEVRGSIDLSQLAGVRLTARVSIEAGTMTASSIARLTAGALVPLAPSDLRRGHLTALGCTLARGGCGVRNGRYAFHVDSTGEGR
jgi:hypothetical protein